MAMSEPALDWRTVSLNRLKVFRGRCLGDLSAREFTGLVDSGLLSKIKEHWSEADPEIRDMYHAVLARIADEQVELVNLSASSGPAAILEPHQQFQSGPDTLPDSVEQSGTTLIAPPPEARETQARSIALPIRPAPVGRRERETNDGVVEQVAGELSESSPVPARASEESPLPEVFRLQSRQEVVWELKRIGPGPAQDRVLETLELADAALGQATSFEQVRQISSIAEVLRACTKELAMTKAIQDEAASFAIRTEHRANELLSSARERGELSAGTRGQLKGRTPLPVGPT
jgi:hypothetical protein